MEQKKKITKAQLERRIANSLVFVPKDKNYLIIYFDDKGLKLEVTAEHTVISTNYHRHVFDNITSNGYSRPYIYTRRFIEIAYENESACIVEDKDGNKSYSYTKLLNYLKDNADKEKGAEYAVAFYCDMWFYNIFNPLYSIDNNDAAQFMVYLNYVCNIAKDSLLLDVRNEDITNKMFFEKFKGIINDIMNEVGEMVILKKKTDDDIRNEAIDELKKIEDEQAINAVVEQDLAKQDDGSENQETV